MRRHLLAILFLVLAGGCVFANTLHNSFHLDDFYRVVDNPGIHRVHPVWRHFVDPGTMATLDRIVAYRPILPLTLSLNYAVAGDSLPGYHLGNLLLQVAASVLVYFLVLSLLRTVAESGPNAGQRAFVPFAVALLFAVHPVSGIPVNYICARDLLLMQVFLVGSFLVWVRQGPDGPSPARWALSLFLLALAMLSKTNAVAMPALVFLFEVIVKKRPILSRRPWLMALPFTLVIAAYFAYTRFVLHFSDAAQIIDQTPGLLWQYPLTQARLHLFHYLRNVVWPFRIRFLPAVPLAESPLEPGVLLGIVLIASSLVAAVRWRRREPLVSFSIFAYWVLMFMESGFLPLYQRAADYRPYFASPFLFLLVVLIGRRLLSGRTFQLSVFATALYFGLSSVVLNRNFRSGEAAWTQSVKYGGEPLAHLNLAMSLPDRTDPRVRRNLEEATRQSPGFVLAHLNLGLLLIDLGQPSAGLGECETAVRLAPGWAQTHFWVGKAYSKLGRNAEAAQAVARAALLDPRNLQYQREAVLAAQRAGDFRASLEFAAKVDAVAPGDPENLFARGFALQMTGDLEGAMRDYRKVLETSPTNVQVTFNLAYALMALGRCAESVPLFRRVLELKPGYAEARVHLASCYEKIGDAGSARRERSAYSPAVGASH